MPYPCPRAINGGRDFGVQLVIAWLALLLMPAAAAAQNGSVSGTVSSGGAPLEGAIIRIFNSSEVEVAFSAPTDATGAYTVSNLVPGDYYAFAFAGNVTGGYVDQLYPGTLCIGTAQAVGTYCRINTGDQIAVAAGATTAGIDFNLTVGGSIAGTVSAETAFTSVELQLHGDLGGAETRGMISTSTNAAGAYTLSRLPPGNYFVWAGNVSGSTSAQLHVGEVYNNQICPQPPLSADSTATCTSATATPVAVTSGTTFTANFSLARGGGLSGTVTALGAPRQSVLVRIYTSDGRFIRSALSDAAGQYSALGLPEAQYRAFTENSEGFRNEVYPDIPCGASCLPVLATGTLVSAPNLTIQGLVDFDLEVAPPVIQAQPQSQVIASGQTATLQVAATGRAPLSYQWYEGTSGNTAAPIAGATLASYTTPALSVAASYWVRVTNDGGSTDSQTATISIGQPANVSSVSANQSVITGSTAVLNVFATGTAPLSYQWYEGQSGSTTTPVAGATSTTFTTPPLTATISYWVRVSNAFGISDSSTVTITVGPPSITGKVTGGVTPLQGAQVLIYNANEVQVLSAVTDAAGAYAVAPLPDGAYFAFVITGNVTGAYVNQLYPNIPCVGTAQAAGAYCRINTGTPIAVTGSLPATGINFNVGVGGSVSGTVTAGGTPYPNTEVQLHVNIGASQTQMVASTSTTALGAYTFARVPAGSYFVWAGNVTGGPPGGHVGEMFDNAACPLPPLNNSGAYCATANATGVPVVSAAVFTANFDLAPGGAIGGAVTALGLPRSNVRVNAYDNGGNLAGFAVTDNSGNYSIRGLPAGPYRLATADRSGLADEVYDNIPCNGNCAAVLGSGAQVAAVAGTTVGGVNFDLTAGPPYILSHPQSRTIASGQTAQLFVSAVTASIPVFYQWYQGISGNTTTPIPGATASSFTTPALTSTTSYWVRVINFQGFLQVFTDSATATISIGQAPQITTEPASQTIPSGQTATLTVAATGTAPLTYQWYAGSSGNTGAPIAGATSSSFTTPPLTGAASYWVRVTNAFGTDDSATATISIGPPPTVVITPANPVAITGGTAVLGTITTGIGPFSYQWYEGLSGTTTTPIAGATSATFTTPPLMVTTRYWVRVSTPFGTGDSATVTVTVGPASITGQVTGGATPLQNASVLVYNANEVQAALATTNAAGAFAVVPLPPGIYYAFVNTGNVTGAYINQLYPNIPCLGSSPQFSGTYCRVQSGLPLVVSAGNTVAGINFNVPVGGSVSGTVTASGTPYNNTEVQLHLDIGESQTRMVASASTNATGGYTFTRVPAGTYFVWAGNVTGGPPGGHVGEMFDNAVCPRSPLNSSGDYCSTADATAVPVIAGAASTANFDLAAGGAIGGTVTALGVPRGNVRVNAYDSGANLAGSALTDGSGNYSIRGLPTGPYWLATADTTGMSNEVYDNIPCNGNCASVLASGTTVGAVAGTAVGGVNFDLTAGPPFIITQPQGRTIASGQTAAMSVVAGSTSALSYQWYQGPSGTETTPIAGATAFSFTTPALTASTSYWVRVTNAEGFTDSATATIAIGQAAQITTEPASQSRAPGQSATLTVAAAGTAPLFYQWYEGASGSTASPIPGATVASYTTPPLTAAATYWVRVINAYGQDDSATATIAVGVGPSITTQPVSQLIGSGQTANLTVAATGTATLIYQWYQGASGVTTAPVAGATGSAFTTPALTTATSYWVRVSNAFGTADSGTASIAIGVGPAIAAQPPDRSIPSGQTTTLAVTATGTAPLTYQWYEGNSGATTLPMSGATASAWTTPALTSSKRYWVRVSNAYGSADSNAAEVTVIPPVGRPFDIHVRAVDGGQMTFTWTGGQGQQPVTNHTIEGGLQGSDEVLARIPTGGPATSVSVPVPNGRFWVRVLAVAGALSSEPSERIDICLNAGCAPLALENVLGAANASDLVLAWNTPLEHGWPDRVRLQVTGAATVALDLPGTAQAFTYSGVPPGTYNFTVAACRGAVCSAPSSPVTLGFPAACSGPPQVPAGFVASKAGSQISLNWDLPAGGPAPTHYQVMVTGSFVGTVPTGARSLAGTVGPGSYTIRIAAANACGLGPATDPITITIP